MDSKQNKGDEFFVLDIPDNFIKPDRKGSPSELDRGAYAKIMTFEWMGQQCCAKVLHSVHRNNPKYEEYFEIEATRWSRLKHSNIVQFLGIWQSSEKDSKMNAIIMERLADNLNGFLDEQQVFGIPTILKRSILYDISSAMMYVHDRDIIHRDLWSKNVLLTSTLIAKVSDFGMAKFYDNDPKTANPGCEPFMPPEVRGTVNALYNKSVDSFSFACIGIHVLTLEWPEPMSKRRGDEIISEFERRQNLLMNLSEDEEKEFLPILKPCLDDESNNRLTFEEIHSMLSKKPGNTMKENRFDIFRDWLKREQESEQNEPTLDAINTPKVQQPIGTDNSATRQDVNIIVVYFLISIIVLLVAFILFRL